jgi:cephalosporin hydroxylase
MQKPVSDEAEFQADCVREIDAQGGDAELKALTTQWIVKAAEHKYSYHFEWLGRPIIQHPQDVVGMQELLWQVQPDLVIETGVARGGSLIFYASMLELIAQCGGPQQARVLGIDIDIREHNRRAIVEHPMSRRIELVQGSSVAASTHRAVVEAARGCERILVCLDSNHTHAHVLEELELYAPLTSQGSYCVVFDTIIEDLPEGLGSQRPWGRSNNPKSAVHAYLERLRERPVTAADGRRLELSIDRKTEHRLLITVAPDGFLYRA